MTDRAASKPTNRGSVLYGTIVADPPWHYDGFAEQLRGPHRQDRERGALQGQIVTRPLPYSSMSVEEIAALPVNGLANKDCRLFLWATSRYLADAIDIARSWGFLYRQLLVWDKRPNVNPLGGSVAPNSCEFLVVATKGLPPRVARWTSSIVNARKAQSVHSAKPPVFMDLVETVSAGPYLELFARSQRLGWDTWGDEALEHVELSA